MMSFKDWINQKYIDYLQTHGEHRTITEFAEWVGVAQVTMSHWMNGNREPGRQKSIDILVSRFGPDVYSVIGKETTRYDYKPLSEAPDWLRESFSAAISEANQQYRAAAEAGRSLSESEARAIINESMAKYGFSDNANLPSNPPAE